MDHVLMVLAGGLCGFIAGYGIAALMMASKCGDCRAEAIEQKQRIDKDWFGL